MTLPGPKPELYGLAAQIDAAFDEARLPEARACRAKRPLRYSDMGIGDGVSVFSAIVVVACFVLAVVIVALGVTGVLQKAIG